MKSLPEHLLDACLAQLNNGVDLEAILAEHPDEADLLRPSLVAAMAVKLDMPPPARRLEGKARLMQSVAERRRTVEATQGYINEIKAGIPIEEVLGRADAGMRELLLAAWRMHSTPAPLPDPERIATGKAQLIQMAERRQAERRRAARAEGRRAVLAGLRAGLAPRPGLLRRAWSGAMAATMAMAMLTAGLMGVGRAAADSLPGDTFYQVKRLGESARMLFAWDPGRRADLEAGLRARREAEIDRLLREGRPLSAGMLQAWFDGRPDALAQIKDLSPAARARLAETLTALLAGGSELGALAGDPALAAGLADWLDALARETAAELQELVAPSAPSAPLIGAPMPVEAPLAPEDRAAATGKLTAPVEVQPPSSAPAEAPVRGAQAPAAPPPADFIQPGVLPPSGDDEESGDEESDAGGSVPAAGGGQASAPSSTPTPPQIIQVPLEPTSTPTPGQGGVSDPPGGGDDPQPSPGAATPGGGA